MSSIKDKLVKYLGIFWDKAEGHVKINLLAVTILVLTLTVSVVWITPNEKFIDVQIGQKYSSIASLYNDTTRTYNDQLTVNELQKEVSSLENEKQLTKIYNVMSYSTILVALVGLLATLLQHIFTQLKFIKPTSDNETKQSDMMKVLAAALISTALIVCVVFAIIFLT